MYLFLIRIEALWQKRFPVKIHFYQSQLKGSGLLIKRVVFAYSVKPPIQSMAFWKDIIVGCLG